MIDWLAFVVLAGALGDVEEEADTEVEVWNVVGDEDVVESAGSVIWA